VPAFAHERYLDHAEDGDGCETGEGWGLRPFAVKTKTSASK
jgi:hypothetical protein